jgi:hypothetical protein
MYAHRHTYLEHAYIPLTRIHTYIHKYTHRLVSVDLHTKVLSFYYRAPGMTPQNWALLQIVSFQPPAAVDSSAGTSTSTTTESTAFIGMPATVNVQARMLDRSVPVTAGDSNTYFMVSFEGPDVFIGDEVKVSQAGNCDRVIYGGGPFAVLTKGVHVQRFALKLNTSGSAQICYASSRGTDRCVRGKCDCTRTMDLNLFIYMYT